MNSNEVREYITKHGEFIIEGYECWVRKTKKTTPAMITAMRMSRFLHSKNGEAVMKMFGYTDDNVIVVADSRCGEPDLTDAVKRNGYPAFIAFTENDSLSVGVIKEL